MADPTPSTTGNATQAASTLAARVYSSDADKATIYDHRLYVADGEFDEWKELAEDWYHRYENLPRRAQMTAKGHRVNAPTGVSVIDVLYSSLTAVDIEILVKNMGNATRMQSELATVAINRELSVLDVQGKANDAVKDGLVASIGWVKVAYEYASEATKMPRLVEDVRKDVVALLAQTQDAGVGTPTPEQIGQLVPLEDDGEKVLRDRIVVDYVPYADVRFDPGAKRNEDITWVAQYTKMRVDEVKENPTWREYVKRTRGGLKHLNDLKGGSTFPLDRLPGGKPTDDDQFVDLVEFWDLQTGTVCTFIKGQKWLLNETVNPFALNFDFKDRSPFVPLVLRKSNTRVRGISDMELMGPSLDEQNVYRTNMAQYIERFKPKVIGPEDALTEEGKEALENDEYGAYVSLAREYGSAVITPMDPPVLPSEAWEMDRRIEDGIREATGVNELMQGRFPDRKRTATETAEVVSASAARQSEKRNTLEQFYIDIARRVMQLMQQFYDQPRMVRYVDSTYGQVPWEFTAEDIQMEYDLELNISPKEAVTKSSERESATAYFNMMMPLATTPLPNGGTLIDGAKLVEWFSTRYGLSKTEILDIINLPEEQQAQQLAAQQATAGMASAEAGAPNPGMTTGPLGPGEVAAMTNQGAVPPDMAAAMQGAGPAAPAATEAISESAGVRLP